MTSFLNKFLSLVLPALCMGFVLASAFVVTSKVVAANTDPCNQLQGTWVGCNPLAFNCTPSNPHCDNPGGNHLTCMNACPGGYYNWGQAGTCSSCANPLWSCDVKPPYGYQYQYQYQYQTPCTYGSCETDAAHGNIQTGNQLSTNGCAKVCNPGTCAPGTTSNPGGCGNYTQYSYDNSCNLVTTTKCNGNCGWTCQGPPYNGKETDSCGNVRANPSCNPAWSQVIGDAYSAGPVSGFVIPSNYTPSYPSGLGAQNPAYFNYFAPSGFSNYGVVSSSSNISFFSPAGTTITGSQTNPPTWVLQNYPKNLSGSFQGILLTPKYDHNYFWNKYKNQVAAADTYSSNTITNAMMQSGSGAKYITVHPASGNTVTINTTLNQNGNGKSRVVFVNNAADPTGTPVNLLIDNGANIDIAPNSPGGHGNTVVWIVSGNVTVKSPLGGSNPDVADGFYIVSQKFASDTAYNPPAGQTLDPNYHGDHELVIHGGVVAYGGVDLKRRNTDPTQPSELVIYNANIVNLLPLLGESTYSWSEISP